MLRLLSIKTFLERCMNIVGVALCISIISEPGHEAVRATQNLTDGNPSRAESVIGRQKTTACTAYAYQCSCVFISLPYSCVLHVSTDRSRAMLRLLLATHSVRIRRFDREGLPLLHN